MIPSLLDYKFEIIYLIAIGLVGEIEVKSYYRGVIRIIVVGKL